MFSTLFDSGVLDRRNINDDDIQEQNQNTTKINDTIDEGINTEGTIVTEDNFDNDALNTDVVPNECMATFTKIGDDKTAKCCPLYVAEVENKRIFHCYITGPIQDVDNFVPLIDALFTATENDTFYIFLDSPGGMIASGGIISSMVHHTPAVVYTIARGLCASAAALIHSSAKNGYSRVSEHAVLMYHMSSHYDTGFSTRIADRAANQVRYVNECLLNKAVQEGHITQEEFDKIQYGEEFFVHASDFKRRIGGK